MTTNITTTKEQSARLLQCGVDPETADMFYQTPITVSQKRRGEDVLLIKKSDATLYDTDTPAWSLSALLSLLPTSMMSANGTAYMLELSKLRMHDQWEVQWWFGGRRWSTSDKSKTYHKLWDKSPIEACVKAIEWLTANNNKLNEL